MPKPQAVLFDAGHTLIEPHNEALAKACTAAGLTVGALAIKQAFRRAITALNQQAQIGPSTFRDLCAIELGRLGLGEGPAEEDFWRVLDDYNAAQRLWTQAIPGAHEMLAALAAREIRVGVVSNSDGFVAHYLEVAGLSSFIDRVVDSHLVGVEKPDPRIFRHALELMNLAPEGIPFVGDRLDCDVEGSRAVGMRGVLYDPSGEAPKGVEVIRSLEELVGIL